MMASVAAGIVTYNPNIPRLNENMLAIISQVSHVYIYDNASTNINEIKKEIEAFGKTITLIEACKNNGMATALNQLSLRAIDAGHSHIVFLDQDSVAQSNLIVSELSCMGNDVGIVTPLVLDRNETTEIRYQGKVETVPRAITSGTLLNLEAFIFVGGYDERLFVDWVDFDFCANLRINGYKILKTFSTSILHELGHKEYAAKIPRRDSNGRLGMRIYYRTNHELWRRRDKARSQAIAIEKYRGTAVGKEELRVILRGLLRTLAFERGRVGTIRATISGWLEGRRIAKQHP